MSAAVAFRAPKRRAEDSGGKLRPLLIALLAVVARADRFGLRARCCPTRHIIGNGRVICRPAISIIRPALRITHRRRHFAIFGNTTLGVRFGPAVAAMVLHVSIVVLAARLGGIRAAIRAAVLGRGAAIFGAWGLRIGHP